jgi:hypothetical protein
LQLKLIVTWVDLQQDRTLRDEVAGITLFVLEHNSPIDFGARRNLSKWNHGAVDQDVQTSFVLIQWNGLDKWCKAVGPLGFGSRWFVDQQEKTGGANCQDRD